MSPKLLMAVSSASMTLTLAACGGGSNGMNDTGSSGATMLPTEYSSEGRPINSCSLSPGCSGVATAPYFASVSVAPASGATLSGVVRFEVRGNQMANVELLPATGSSPRLGVFNVTPDKTFAWLDLDTSKLPNGAASARISAFNVPAGQAGGTEIVAMPARSWTVSNTAPSAGGFTAAVSNAPANGAVVKGTVRLEVRGTNIANAELLPASGYAPRYGAFNVSADRTYAWLDFDTRSLSDGVRALRISAFSGMPGQPGATEVVAMPARNWNFSNASTAAFTATATTAPLNGETVSGNINLEIRGTGIQNAELLPATGYAPIYGTFSVSADQTYAWLNVDASALPAGPLNVRVSAYNVPAGQPGGKEIVAMPVRQWNVQH